MTTGILLVNLGTPDSPAPKDVKRYLLEFLTDGRVIDVPYLMRQFLVRGIIVPRRYKESARSYQEIWTKEGSPLKVYGKRITEGLQKRLGPTYNVQLAMRYQNPSIPEALERLKGCSHITILPLFPQYASATTGSIHQKVMETLQTWQTIPSTHFINSYPTHPKMIRLFALNASNAHDYDHVLFSFHGLPERHLTKAHPDCLTDACCGRNGGCYASQCRATARAIARELNLTDYTVCFQSRLGKDPWIQPYTIDTIRAHPNKRLLVFCPAFTADCLETIHEIGVEYRDEYLASGGKALDLVPSLNDDPLWIETLLDLATGAQAQSLSIPSVQTVR